MRVSAISLDYAEQILARQYLANHQPYFEIARILDIPLPDMLRFAEQVGEELEVKAAKRSKVSQTAVRQNYLKTKYGITLEEYEQMLRNQAGCCGICGTHKSQKERKLAIDHDHTTNEIRGLLCTECNTSLGKLGDNVEGILKALRYLSNPPAQRLRKEGPTEYLTDDWASP